MRLIQVQSLTILGLALCTLTGQASNPWVKFRRRAQAGAHIPASTIPGWVGLGQEVKLEQEADHQLRNWAERK